MSVREWRSWWLMAANVRPLYNQSVRWENKTMQQIKQLPTFGTTIMTAACNSFSPQTEKLHQSAEKSETDLQLKSDRSSQFV